MAHFLLILAMAGIGALFALPVILIPALFAPRNPTPMKRATFEAGQVPTGEARVHLIMQYYAYLLIFVVFDVISMFLFAWAFTDLNAFSVLVIGMFLAIIFIPAAYAIFLAGKRDIW
jgi:NADH-quinone oxidoreductase subunit A